jgi:ADP-ribose pyrophosphatase YjhB (NUDIX family)
MSLTERIEEFIVAVCRMLNIKIKKVAAGVIIERKEDGKFLLVQEKRPIPGIFEKWNLPMGRATRKERKNLSECAGREGEEESGYRLRIVGLIRPHPKRDYYIAQAGAIKMIVSVFEAEIVGGELKVPPDLLNVQWFSFEEIEKLRREAELIDPYVRDAIADYMELEFARRATSEML